MHPALQFTETHNYLTLVFCSWCPVPMSIVVAFIFILKSQKSSACIYALGLTLKNIHSHSTADIFYLVQWTIAVANSCWESLSWCLDLRCSLVLEARMAIPRNSRTFHNNRGFWMISSVQFQCFDWIFPFNHVVLLLEFYVLELDCTNFKHYLARKC